MNFLFKKKLTAGINGMDFLNKKKIVSISD